MRRGASWFMLATPWRSVWDSFSLENNPRFAMEDFEHVPDRPWYFSSQGQQRGPAGEEQIRQLIDLDMLPYDALVWREGWRDWQPARATTLEAYYRADQKTPLETFSVATAPPAPRQRGRLWRTLRLIPTVLLWLIVAGNVVVTAGIILFLLAWHDHIAFASDRHRMEDALQTVLQMFQ